MLCCYFRLLLERLLLFSLFKLQLVRLFFSSSKLQLVRLTCESFPLHGSWDNSDVKQFYSFNRVSMNSSSFGLVFR